MTTKKNHLEFLALALKEAEKAGKLDEVPVGAVIVQDGRVIARGRNNRETKQSVLGHAELVAMSKATKKLGSWRLEGCDVYVTLEPCPMCAAALQQARVRNVYYGVPDPKAGAIALGFNLHDHPRMNHRFTMTDLGMKACGEILSVFFKKKRAKS